MTAPSAICVALSTRDGERHLQDQLDSLERQTVPPSLLVARDDGSTDGSLALLRAFARRATFPVEVIEGEPIGLARSIEVVLGRIVGASAAVPAVALCDQDDVWEPGRLARAADRLAGPDAPSAVAGDGVLVDQAGVALGGSTWTAVGFRPRLRARFRRDPVRVLAYRSVLAGHATVFRGDVVERSLPFPEVVREPVGVSYPDRWLSLVAAGSGRIDLLDEPVVSHRQHPGQATGVSARRLTLVARAVRRGVVRALGGGGAVRESLTYRSAVLREAADRTGNGSLGRAAAHLTRRARLPEARARRLAPVVAEIRSGSYRWSGGTQVALADLVRPLPPFDAG